MKLYNTFTGAVMNKDLEVRLMPKGIYLDAKNIRVMSSDSQNSRSLKLPLGNTAVSDLTFGNNAECVGECIDSFRNKIYWAVVSDSGSFVCEHDVVDGTENIVLSDNRAVATNLFGFVAGGYVEMRVINDNDNGKNFLVITNNIKEPKFFNIETAKTLTDNTFVFEDVSLIKSPPSTAPTLELGATATGNENNLESKFLSFAYRYQYQNEEYSALSQFSEFAFLPDSFSYNYKAGTNNSMFNDFSKVDITLNTGTSNVKEVQLIVKESGSNTAYIIDTYNKAKEDWGNNDTEVVTFDNSRIYRALSADQLTRIFDNVPTKAATLEVIGNRIVFGNYTDGYDLTYNDANANLAFALTYVSATGASGTPHKQVKTNRDYEIALSYSDGKGRITTPLVSPNNTTFVPYSVADERVRLRLTIDRNSRPPEWATQYRLYIKQSKVDYDVIAPIIFYRSGVDAWIKLEGNDVQKVKEGDFLYVKSDTSGLKNTTVRTKVLEVKTWTRNFLETDTAVINGETTLQEAGTYMRLQVTNFSLSPDEVSVFEGSTTGFRSGGGGGDININGSTNYIEAPYYDGSGLDDITASGTIIGGNDVRFEIEITGAGTPNVFQWRSWDVSLRPNTGYGSPTTAVEITGSSQTLGGSGISIEFGQTTGHTVGDKWFVSAKASAREDDWNRTKAGAGTDSQQTIMSYQGKNAPNDQGIKAGAIIRLTYNDSANGSSSGLQGFTTVNLTSSSDYPNIEEWFYGDNIVSNMTPITDDITKYMFRRGTSNGRQTTGTQSDNMFMMILSPASYVGSGQLSTTSEISITEFDNNIILETVPLDVTTDVFFELPYTYNISSNIHQGDTNQVFGSVDAVITLEYFNSFGWYNGFESYKIGDTFNEKTMIVDTKPLIPIQNYRAIQRVSSLTYGNAYESTTQFNGLNEFNLATLNYKDLDIKYGAIAKLFSRDTDLLVFQHDKTHRILFSKSILFNGDGTGNVTQSTEVLGQEVAYAGEYGICKNPESFAFFGNRIIHLDVDRGALMRLSTDGYTEISKKGMSDYFRKLTTQSRFVGGYDLYNDEYLINLALDSSPLTVSFIEGEDGGFSSFYEFQPERFVGINNRLYSFKNGQLYLHDSNDVRNNFYGDQRVASVTTLFNDSPNDVKHWKSVNLESTNPWTVSLTTPFATGGITTSEFSLEEGEYYAYIRQSETTGLSTGGLSTFQGIGTIATIVSNTIGFGFEIPKNLAIGDVLYEHNVSNDTQAVRGTVTAINFAAGTVTVDTAANLLVGDFILYSKNARIEGEAIKGYYLEIQLTNASTTNQELFAVKVEAVRSFD